MDSPQLAILIPTRGEGRYMNVHRLVAALRRTCVTNPLIALCVDPDQDQDGSLKYNYPTPPARFYYSFGMGMGQAINAGAAQLLREYPDTKAIAVLNDDHFPHTKGWDRIFLDKIAGGALFVWGRDGIQNEKLATAPTISAEVWWELGWLALPTLRHLYVDNVWTDLARATEYQYLERIEIEHLHHETGQAAHDLTYQLGSGRHDPAATDESYYQIWRDGAGYDRDVARLRRLLDSRPDRV